MMELRDIPLFESLSQDTLAWVDQAMDVREAEPGDVLFAEGDPPSGLFILLAGELTLTKTVGGREEVLTRHRISGDPPETDKPSAANFFTGEVQLLTGEPHIATATVTAPGRVGVLCPADFEDMLGRCPEIARVMLPVLAWRIRAEETKARERGMLTALGTVAAGLAHELNNPAAAAKRATAQLPRAIVELEAAAAAWSAHGHRDDVRQGLTARTGIGALAAADLEDEISDWLDDHGQEAAAAESGLLADGGADPAWLDALAGRVGEALEPALRYLCAILTVESLATDLTDSVSRLSALVDDVRTYTQLDRAPEQEVDIHQGLESTLRLLSAKSSGITVHRDYDPALPLLTARGAELNQVWTNLIDNALDALGGKGELHLRTRRDGTCVAVEIADTGPGIPQEIRGRLFEPFFTTKDIGKGTGLGLHIVYRVVTEQHGGSIEVDSAPGRTSMVVRLPGRS
ncbi:ATP-binding protein [Nonomuraea sp. LPB2021202275-12-8]|uniref:ATP-binding protein n=1 Tax=Nonomuraea sp. LPB2021202275-12-8 TaxID=3120159 RepID=UPI00300CF1A8